jgi:hypothetical protein
LQPSSYYYGTTYNYALYGTHYRLKVWVGILGPYSSKHVKYTFVSYFCTASVVQRWFSPASPPSHPLMSLELVVIRLRTRSLLKIIISTAHVHWCYISCRDDRFRRRRRVVLGRPPSLHRSISTATTVHPCHATSVVKNKTNDIFWDTGSWGCDHTNLSGSWTTYIVQLTNLTKMASIIET